MPLPPQHTITATPVLVLESDTAWNRARYDAEVEDLGEGEDHPLDLYWSGATRYDLAAVSEYLDESNGEATRFHLRRVTRSEWTRIKELIRSDETGARAEALRLGLSKVTGGPWDELRLEAKHATDGRLTHADLDALDKHYRAYFDAIGLAVIAANREFGYVEGKRSGS